MTACITRIEPHGRRKLEAALELDGAAWTVLDMETLVRERLSVGLLLTPERVEQVLRADAIIRARRAAAGYAARAPRTRRELEHYLATRGYTPGVAEAALEGLASSGTLDDARAAESHTRKRRRAQYGPRRIEAELRARGVQGALVRETLSKATAGADLAAECLALARKQAARLGDLADPKQRRRLQDWLLRRGYEGETIAAALRQLSQPSPPDPSED